MQSSGDRDREKDRRNDRDSKDVERDKKDRSKDRERSDKYERDDRDSKDSRDRERRDRERGRERDGDRDRERDRGRRDERDRGRERDKDRDRERRDDRHRDEKDKRDDKDRNRKRHRSDEQSEELNGSRKELKTNERDEGEQARDERQHSATVQDDPEEEVDVPAMQVEDDPEARRLARQEKWRLMKLQREKELGATKTVMEIETKSEIAVKLVTNDEDDMFSVTTNATVKRESISALLHPASHASSDATHLVQNAVADLAGGALHASYAYDRSLDVDRDLLEDAKAEKGDVTHELGAAQDAAHHVDMFADDEIPLTVSALRSSGVGLVRDDAEPTDDHEGYYCYRLGEMLGKRYTVIGYHGKGVFSNVLKCKDTVTGNEVAIKLLRNNEHMKRAGKKEIEILKSLRESDPDGKYNNITLLNDFQDRDHLCLVFEPMDMNLRQLLKKYGGQGISVTAIRVYAFKILKALTHLARNNIIHADIKPDNILIDKDRTTVKVADLGSAMELQEAEPTPMLVSRYYRAPEIILGVNYHQTLDVFSLGCCLYELATGKPLLFSRDNNHHLKLICQLKGAIPKKLLTRARYKELYFDQGNTFLETSPDPGDKSKDIVRKVHFGEPTRNIYKEILDGNPHANNQEKRQIQQLADLIEKCTEVDPDKRISARDCLKHALFCDTPMGGQRGNK